MTHETNDKNDGTISQITQNSMKNNRFPHPTHGHTHLMSAFLFVLSSSLPFLCTPPRSAHDTLPVRLPEDTRNRTFPTFPSRAHLHGTTANMDMDILRHFGRHKFGLNKECGRVLANHVQFCCDPMNTVRGRISWAWRLSPRPHHTIKIKSPHIT